MNILEVGIEHGKKIGLEDGEKIGMERGETIGMERGMERANRLTEILIDAGRMDDLKRSTHDSKYRGELLREFGI